MVALDEGNTGAGNSGGSPIRKKARGSTKLRPIVTHCEEQRGKVHMDFNADLNPISTEENRFISYIGYLSRSKVDILWPNWKEVPTDMKAMIWEQLLEYNSLQKKLSIHSSYKKPLQILKFVVV